jgi:exodeoxyribonuclease VII small subunit
MSHKPTYEAQIAELEAIVAAIESEAIGVDELAAKVKRAAELLRNCQTVLQATGKEIDDILKDMG